MIVFYFIFVFVFTPASEFALSSGVICLLDFFARVLGLWMFVKMCEREKGGEIEREKDGEAEEEREDEARQGKARREEFVNQ